MEDNELDDAARVRIWLGRLEGFAETLDTIEGVSATDFASDALEGLNDVVLPNLISNQDPAMLLALEAVSVVTRTTTAVIMDWADTPDVRDRHTRDSAKQLVEEALRDALSEGKRWLTEGLPDDDEVKQRIAKAARGMQDTQEMLGQRNAEMEAQDVEAEADPYGAVLLYRDPSVSDAPIFTKVCSFTEEEDDCYANAHERIRRMLDSELLQHISDEADRLCDVLIAVLSEVQSQRVSLADEDAMDERRRRIRSALIPFTAALQIHEYQSIRDVRSRHGLGREEVVAVKALFEKLKTDSFAYRWLEALRDALQHGDINAFKFSFSVSMSTEPEVTINLDRAFMRDFIGRENRRKPWLRVRELQDLDEDPSVLDMIREIQPLMGPFQEKLDKVLYPNVGDDVATVRELIGRYEGRQGKYFRQTGPGFTRRRLAPPVSPLAPRVLYFADTYGADSAVVDRDDQNL